MQSECIAPLRRAGKLLGIESLGLSAIGALCFVVASSAQRPATTEGSATTVKVKAGTLMGRLLPNGQAVYKGIPFAKPPVGSLRWHEPLPVEPWSGVRNALDPGASCAQSPGGVNQDAAERSAEDCLYL